MKAVYKMIYIFFIGEISLALWDHAGEIIVHCIFLFLRDAFKIIHMHLNFILTSFFFSSFLLDPVMGIAIHININWEQ